MELIFYSIVTRILQYVYGGYVYVYRCIPCCPIDKLSVVITICLSFMFLKEPINAKVIVGALLITAGSIVMLYK